jgi:predicted DNA-binding protein YlxM (UPF0122 family)
MMDKRRDNILQFIENGFSLQRIGNIFGVSKHRIWQIKHNKKQIITSSDTIKIYNGVKERDGYKCKLCGNGSILRLVIHHMDSNHNNNNKLNLITLCNRCHSSLHGSKRCIKKLSS